MYLGYQNNKIKFYVEQPLNPKFYNVDRWEQTDKEYVLEGDEYVQKTPEWEKEQLNNAKQAKYNEANNKAREYLESGEALYPFVQNEETYHIEATDGNIAKIGLKATALLMAQDLETTFPWNTKEDINIQINALEGKEIAEGLGVIQDEVWTVKFPAYNEAIAVAETVEEVNAIDIVYTSEISQEEGGK